MTHAREYSIYNKPYFREPWLFMTHVWGKLCAFINVYAKSVMLASIHMYTCVRWTLWFHPNSVLNLSWFMINIVWGKLSGFIQCSYMIFHVVDDKCGRDNLVCGFMIHSYVKIQWCLLLRMFILWWVNYFRCKFNSPCSKFWFLHNMVNQFWDEIWWIF
jgi:hypothetical protein